MIKMKNNSFYKAHGRVILVWLILLIGVFIISLSSISAWSTNIFNNGLSTENLTFTGNQNITRYLSIPSSTAILTNGYLNLSGYNTTEIIPVPIISSDLTSSYTGAGYLYKGQTYKTENKISVNAYILPTGSTSNLGRSCGIYTSVDSGLGTRIAEGTIIIERGHCNLTNEIILNKSTTYFLLFDSNTTASRLSTIPDYYSDGKAYYCTGDNTGCIDSGRDSSSISLLGNVYYEPNNISVNMGNNLIFYYPNLFNQTNNKTTNLANTLNQYLTNTYLVGSNYEIPFIFHSDSSGILEYSDLIFNGSTFSENSQTYNTAAYELSNENFKINLTYGSYYYSTITANLIYNGTSYAGTKIGSGNNVLFSANAIAPPVSSTQNVSFYWEFSLFNGTSTDYVNSSVNNQTINTISLSKCTSGNLALNFTFYDEQNMTKLDSNTFDATLYYSATIGGLYKELNITNSSTNEVDICISQNSTVYLNSIIAYSKSGYPIRNWFYQNYPISNNTIKVPLYLLKTASSTSFILQVQNDAILPVPNVLVEAQRCYPGTNTIETVFKSRTDSNGLTVGNLEAETALYKFLITNESNTILDVTPCSKIVPQTTPYTLLFQIGAGYQSPFINIENVTDITETLVYDNSNNILTLTYSDTSGKFDYASLIVKSLNYSGSNEPIVCSNNNSVSSGIITCNVSIAGSYSATAYVYRADGTTLIDQITFTVSTVASTLGYYGAFLGFFIILISAFAFKFNEIAGIVLVNVSVIACNLIGLIAFGPVFIVSLICISIVIIGVIER